MSHVRYVSVARAISCARNSRAVGRVSFKFVMANINDHTLSTELEDALLNEDPDKTRTTANQDPMFSMLQNINKTFGAMADSILNMNQSLKRLHPSNTDDRLDPKRQKHSSKDEMSASDGSDEDGDDSDEALQGLCGTETDKTSKEKPRARLEQRDCGNDPLLSEIAEDLLSVDETGPAAEKQLADFINNLWSKKLPDSKLKDKSAKYLRPANCETQNRGLTLKSHRITVKLQLTGKSRLTYKFIVLYLCCCFYLFLRLVFRNIFGSAYVTICYLSLLCNLIIRDVF